MPLSIPVVIADRNVFADNSSQMWPIKHSLLVKGQSPLVKVNSKLPLNTLVLGIREKGGAVSLLKRGEMKNGR